MGKSFSWCGPLLRWWPDILWWWPNILPPGKAQNHHWEQSHPPPPRWLGTPSFGFFGSRRFSERLRCKVEPVMTIKVVVQLFWIFQPGCFGFWGSVLCVAQSNVILHKVRIFDRESWKLSAEDDSEDDNSADRDYNDGDDYSDDVDDHLPMTFRVAPALIMWCLL